MKVIKFALMMMILPMAALAGKVNSNKVDTDILTLVKMSDAYNLEAKKKNLFNCQILEALGSGKNYSKLSNYTQTISTVILECDANDGTGFGSYKMLATVSIQTIQGKQISSAYESRVLAVTATNQMSAD